jgi:hypothetical protein
MIVLATLEERSVLKVFILGCCVINMPPVYIKGKISLLLASQAPHLRKGDLPLLMGVSWSY